MAFPLLPEMPAVAGGWHSRLRKENGGRDGSREGRSRTFTSLGSSRGTPRRSTPGTSKRLTDGRRAMCRIKLVAGEEAWAGRAVLLTSSPRTPPVAQPGQQPYTYQPGQQAGYAPSQYSQHAQAPVQQHSVRAAADAADAADNGAAHAADDGVAHAAVRADAAEEGA